MECGKSSLRSSWSATTASRFADLFCEDGVYHDVFYGAFAGRAKIAEMIDDWFYRLTGVCMSQRKSVAVRRRDALCALHLQLPLDTTRG